MGSDAVLFLRQPIVAACSSGAGQLPASLHADHNVATYWLRLLHYGVTWHTHRTQACEAPHV